MKSMIIITKEQLRNLKESDNTAFMDILVQNGQPWQWGIPGTYEYACELVNQ